MWNSGKNGELIALARVGSHLLALQCGVFWVMGWFIRLFMDGSARSDRPGLCESGVAFHFPPQSKALSRKETTSALIK